jgi:hypothetical protein
MKQAFAHSAAIRSAAMDRIEKVTRVSAAASHPVKRLIATLPRRGFRFVGPVDVAPADAPSPGAPNAGEQDDLPEPVDIELTLPARPSIAVLPIQALGDGERVRLLAAGLGDDLTVRLACTRWLFVSAFGWK